MYQSDDDEDQSDEEDLVDRGGAGGMA